jgi:CRISPR-associated endonuclease/helicase Cas3
MNILLVSQCEKSALRETRRILDQFAERRGDRTWQTSITQEGLDTLRRLLRKTARKNTAVACHWIRAKDHTELLWIVGDRRQFNDQGAVPTNTTQRNVLRRESENDWHTGEDIRLLAALASLLHDLGKASVAFQQRLKKHLPEKNLYRHEWVSLRLFQAFVGDDGDEIWLRRMADPEAFDEQAWIAPGRYQRDGLDASERHPFRKLPPLAAAIGWLVVTHHRLPVFPVNDSQGIQTWLGKRATDFNPAYLEEPLKQMAHNWNEVHQAAARERIEPYWNLAGPLPVVEKKWRAQAAKLATRLLALRERREDQWLDNPYVMHLARLSLMLADHYYSSLGIDKDGEPVSERKAFVHEGQRIVANTTFNAGGRTVPNQSLVEHLLGVGHTAALIVHALPGFERYLPRLANHRGLRKRSADPRFAWQDKAADAAGSMRVAAREHGVFVVNMASTGCGKTLANARVLYALADPQLGLRATYALGLRTLTLQTGRSYRQDLHLDDDELAVLVGGSASRALFEYYEAQAEASGSASAQSLIEEDSHVLYEGNTADHPLLARALHDPDIRKLLSAPMLVCTVDHIAPATESLRAGRQIAPMLRLMSSDLILDELDDYDLNDLPALTRLVHWAGMLGTRVVLSSATLPPALVEGMFMAYRAGREHFRRNRGATRGDGAIIEVPCLWTDEFGVRRAQCSDAEAFATEHAAFVEQRATRLRDAAPLRRGELLPLNLASRKAEDIHAEFAQHLRDACLRLHGDHAETDPASGKRISFGLVRMANIDPLFDVARSLYALGAPEDTRIHLCVYHARFPLVQRSAIEHLLDTTFNRRGDSQAVYRRPDIRRAIDAHPERNQLFVVLASPVCEVGRDWDADWAVAEPSSMRSLIQLAGRVQRHRAKSGEKPNVLIFDTNLLSFKRGSVEKPAFVRPGFEKGELPSSHFRLETLWLHDLLAEDEYRVLSAIPRIQPRPQATWQPRRRLVDLEQARVYACMQYRPASVQPKSRRAPISSGMERDEAPVAWRYPQAALTGMLPQQQPFRDDNQPKVTLVFLPDEDEEKLVLHRVEDKEYGRRGEKLYVCVDQAQRHSVVLHSGIGISPWGGFDLMSLLAEQAEHLDLSLVRCAEWMATVEVSDSKQGWRYHPRLGFGEEK